MRRTFSAFKRPPRMPLREFSSTLKRLFPWLALTYVNPSVAKSPTWATPRKPYKLVKTVSLASEISLSRRWTAGLSMREAMKVKAYLSDCISHWMPSKSGFEKVIGVSVVRSCSPTVSAV